MRTIAEDYGYLASCKVDEATTARLNGDNELANSLLREAVDLYMKAEDYEDAHVCRMLIVSE